MDKSKKFKNIYQKNTFRKIEEKYFKKENGNKNPENFWKYLKILNIQQNIDFLENFRKIKKNFENFRENFGIYFLHFLSVDS